MTLPSECDVLVIGSGNAGLCAAISAAQNSRTKENNRILIIDKCPEAWAGGNSYFTAGAFRTVHGGLPDLLPLVNNIDADLSKKVDIPPYTPQAFTADINRVTNNRTHPALSQILIADSNDTVKWLRNLGVRFQLSFNRQAYEVDGRVKFWGGLALKTEDGGKGLVDDLGRAARALGVGFCFRTAARQIMTDDDTGRVKSVVVSQTLLDGTLAKAREILVKKGVILAAGASKPTLVCARSISARTGTWRWSVARRTTPAIVWRWPFGMSTQSRPGTGRAVTAWRGMRTRRQIRGIVRFPMNTRNRAIR